MQLVLGKKRARVCVRVCVCYNKAELKSDARTKRMGGVKVIHALQPHSPGQRAYVAPPTLAEPRDPDLVRQVVPALVVPPGGKGTLSRFPK